MELRALFRDPASFDAFCVDYYPEIAARFQSGMERVDRENLLLLTQAGEHVAASVEALRKLAVENRKKTFRSALILACCALLVACVSGVSGFLAERHRQREPRQILLEALSSCVDSRQCVTLFQQANQFCEQGEQAACLLVAAMMRTGTGTNKEPTVPLFRLEKLCNSGYWPACHLAGQLLMTGEVMKSPKRAQELFKMACENRYYVSCVSVARSYYFEKDADKAKHYFQIACNAGVALGCTGLGSLYENDRGVPKRDVDEAIRLYRSACQQGEPHACRNLGMIYREGEPGSIPSDPVRAFKEFEKSCSMQGGAGCRNLGYAYRHSEGTNRDTSKAFLAYQKSCELRDAQGCFNLADMHTSGDLMSPSLENAFQNYRMSCDLGLAAGCMMVGEMYSGGKFVALQPAAARQYFELACRLGNSEGCSRSKQRM